MNKIETTPKVIDNNKNTWSYTKMDILFKEISKYWISKGDFVNRFLEIYEGIEFRYSNIFLNNCLKLETFRNNFFSLAIKKIIELEKGSEERLNFPIFCSPKTNQFWEDPEHFREVPKYETFLKLLYKKYWLRLEWVEIKTYIETLEPNSINLPYRIITIKTKGISRTILINNQIWEDTYIYKWIIEPDFLSSINKWDMVNGDFPISIKYFDKYESNLEILFDNNFLLSWLKLLDYENSEHIEILLWRITDKNWYTVEVDLRNILTSNFSRLYFWDWTVFWRLLWQSILIKTWWRNRIYLKKLLEVWWISRPDLLSRELDCKNPKHIRKLLSKITEKDWENVDINLNTIQVWVFSELYFWYGTGFWVVRWSRILENNWWKNSKALKKVLLYSWIKRLDLYNKKIDYKNPKHISILLSSITNKKWNKVDIDLKTIWITGFARLYFWYSTEFWMFCWHSILYNTPWENSKSLKKILGYLWIPRPDL